MGLEDKIKSIITSEVQLLNRQDLFRAPLIAFSSAHDERYTELKSLIGDWHLLPTQLLPSSHSVISYFVPFTKEVAEAPKNAVQESPLWGESYVVINAYFAHINELVCQCLIEQGYDAITIPATGTYDPKDMKSMWSHKSAAAIAGLGAFSANRMLITAKGSAGRFCTVITSAKLHAEPLQPIDRCLYHRNGSCGLCFAVCPPKALRGGDIDKFACQAELNKNKYLLETNNKLPNASTCGKCVSICPFAYIA